MEYKVDTLIVGGGISGLSAASLLRGDWLLLEREDELGGYCRTLRRNGFIWDWAGHFFHFRDGAAEQFFRSHFAPGELVEREKCTKILYHGQLIDYPFQTHIHELPEREFLSCLADLLDRSGGADTGSFLDMLYERFGRAITEAFLRPYNEKLYACELSTLDARAMGRFFPPAELSGLAAALRGAETVSYNSRFLYPKGGAGAFIEALSRGLPPERLRTGRALVQVDAMAHLAVDSAGDSYRYRTLINSAPLNRFLPLIAGQPYRAFGETLSWNKVLVLNLGFARKGPMTREHWLYVPGSDANYYRVGYYDNILGSDRMSLYVEIAFASDAAVDAGRELENALSALHRQGLVQVDNALVDHEALLMDPAYVHISTESEAAVRLLKKELALRGICTLGRYGGWCYCSMEDCMRESRALARRLNGAAQERAS